MAWMADEGGRRSTPRSLWAEVRSIVMLGVNYGPEGDPLATVARPDRGTISVYAQGRDYHDVIKGRLKELAGFLAARSKGDVKVFVDTAPVMEKPLAEAAGLGWQGKHTVLVSREFGNWLFLGAIFTTATLPPDPPERDRAVEQVQAVERHDRQLAAAQRVERRRVRAQHDWPGHRSVEAGLAADQLRAGRQEDFPGGANGDVGHVYLLRSWAVRPRPILDCADGAPTRTRRTTRRPFYLCGGHNWRAAARSVEWAAMVERPVLASVTIARNELFQDPVALWRDVVNQRPHGRARLSLASALIAAGRENDAVSELRLAAADYPPAKYALGSALNATGHTDEAAAALRQLPPGRYAKLTVTDTGTGMDEETQRRVFEPFFTTKGNKGTGLGLSIVYSIAEQSRGRVMVESAPGTGTRFDVILPAV